MNKYYYDSREYTKENFSSMLTESDLWENAAKNCIQILIHFFDDKQWINIKKSDIKDYKLIQNTLEYRIREGIELSDSEKDQLYSLVSKGCREKTNNSLKWKIYHRNVKAFRMFGIFSRVHFDWYDNKPVVFYCAGQSQPEEITYLRKCILES